MSETRETLEAKIEAHKQIREWISNLHTHGPSQYAVARNTLRAEILIALANDIKDLRAQLTALPPPALDQRDEALRLAKEALEKYADPLNWMESSEGYLCWYCRSGRENGAEIAENALAAIGKVGG